jgi:hypothetical protein
LRIRLELKNLEIFVLSERRDGGRGLLLENAAIFERLREQLPGWVSREMIVDDACAKGNSWPIAIAKFTQSAETASAKDTEGGKAPEDNQTGETSLRRSRPPAQDEDIIVAAWRVEGGTADSPYIYLSAAKCDSHGFKLPPVSDESLKNVAEMIRLQWGKRGIRVVNEFTLMPLNRLEKKLFVRLGKKISPGRKPTDAKVYSTEKRKFQIVKQSATFDLDSSGDELVYSGVPAPDEAHINALKRLLAKSVNELAETMGRFLDVNGSIAGIDGFFDSKNGVFLTIYAQPTSFYPGYALYRMVCGGTEAYAVAPDWNSLAGRPAAEPLEAKQAREEHAIILDGKSFPIHELNKKLGDRKQITEETATDYLCFFCKFVHGEEGAFLVLKPAQDLDWMDFPLVEDSRKHTVAKSIVGPAALAAIAGEEAQAVLAETQAKDAKFHRLATLSYGEDLFLSSFEVMTTGSIGMLEEHWLIRSLPVRPFKFTRDKHTLVYETHE